VPELSKRLALHFFYSLGVTYKLGIAVQIRNLTKIDTKLFQVTPSELKAGIGTSTYETYVGLASEERSVKLKNLNIETPILVGGLINGSYIQTLNKRHETQF